MPNQVQVQDSTVLANRQRVELPRLSIESVGIASAQGSAEEILSRQSYLPPRRLPWSGYSHTEYDICRPAERIGDDLTGNIRMGRLAQLALNECISSKPVGEDTPLIIASCNGSANSFNDGEWITSFDTSTILAGTPWEGQLKPVVSGSCSSALQALFLASWLLQNGSSNVVVLAVDILSPASHRNFESLRVLSLTNELPWDKDACGFVPGEAAVALNLQKWDEGIGGIPLSRTHLTQNLASRDGFLRALSFFDDDVDGFIVGQGAGPHDADKQELEAFQSRFSSKVPVATPVYHFGHTLGASAMLSIALAHFTLKGGNKQFWFPELNFFERKIAPGNPEVLVSCRALDGHCGASLFSSHRVLQFTRQAEWLPTGFQAPLFNTTLREIVEEALQFRPSAPPDVLFVKLDAPLKPAPQSVIGNRILPSSVLEITPGFVSQLIAKCWGFIGPSIALVGDPSTSAESDSLIHSCVMSGLSTYVVHVKGHGVDREIDWNVH